MTIAEIAELVQTAGIVFLLIIALYGGSKGWWVFGRTHDAALVRENEWKAMALRLLPLAEKSATVAEAVVKNGNGR